MKLKPLVSVVIPVLNGMHYLPRFLREYSRTDYFPRETIFIDDGSVDGSVVYIENFYKKQKKNGKFIIIRNKKKLGIAGSRNIGIKKAKGKYVAFVEVDMGFRKDWLTQLLKVCEKDSKIGAVNSKVMDFDNRRMIMGAGIKLVPQTGWVIPIGLGETDKGQYNKIDNTLITAVGSLVLKRVLTKIGGFDKLLNRNVEDIDLGWRISLAGYDTLYVPNAVVYHAVAKNPQKRSDVTSFKQQFNLAKNIRLIFKNYAGINVFLYFPEALFINFIRAFKRIFNGDAGGAFGIFFSFVWFIFFLPSNILERYKVSGYRRFSDREVMERIMLNGNFAKIYKDYLNPTRKVSVELSLQKN